MATLIGGLEEEKEQLLKENLHLRHIAELVRSLMRSCAINISSAAACKQIHTRSSCISLLPCSMSDSMQHALHLIPWTALLKSVHICRYVRAWHGHSDMRLPYCLTRLFSPKMSTDSMLVLISL